MVLSIGYPVFFDLHQFFQALQHFPSVEGRKSQLFVGDIHPFEVFIGPEQSDSLIVSDVSFEALETLNAVVQCRIGRVQLERLIRLDHRLAPPSIVHIVVDIQNVVRREIPENVLVVLRRLGL